MFLAFSSCRCWAVDKPQCPPGGRERRPQALKVRPSCHPRRLRRRQGGCPHRPPPERGRQRSLMTPEADERVLSSPVWSGRSGRPLLPRSCLRSCCRYRCCDPASTWCLCRLPLPSFLSALLSLLAPSFPFSLFLREYLLSTCHVSGS